MSSLQNLIEYNAAPAAKSAATRAAELQDAFGSRIFVARDEDGYYFAHEAQSNA